MWVICRLSHWIDRKMQYPYELIMMERICKKCGGKKLVAVRDIGK